MQVGPLEEDSRQRDWLNRFFYPVALVQTFRPCHWSNLRDFFEEGEVFHGFYKERALWLKDCKIRCNLHYCTEELTTELPREYRLYTEFKSLEGAEAYKLRWSNG